MSREEIEQGFANTGWDIDGSFSDYLLIGFDGDGLSILGYKEAWEPQDPIFELVDHERNVTYQVQEIPSPPASRTAAQGERPATRGGVGQPLEGLVSSSELRVYLLLV